MREMTKNIKIAFDVDKVKYREVDKLMKKLTKDLKLVDDKDVKELEEMMGKFKENGFKIDSKEAKDVLDKLQALQRRGFLNRDDLKAFRKESKLEQFAQGFKSELTPTQKITAESVGMKSAQLLKQAFEKVGEELKQTFKDSFEKLNKLIKYSRYTNDETWNNLMLYGFNPAQSYGVERAKEFVGLDSIEEYYKLQPDQQKAFQEKLLKETQRYQKLYDSGYFTKMQEFQWEYQNFRDDVEFEFMNFFIENKEVIFDFLKITAESTKSLAEFFVKIGTAIKGRQEMSEEARYASTKEEFFRGTNVNVNIDNTFNNVAKSDQTWLANAGEMTYEQLIKVLYKGGI